MSSGRSTSAAAAASPAPVFISDREVNLTIGRNNIIRTLWCNIFLVIGSTITFGPIFDKYVLTLSNRNWVVGVVESASGITSLLVFVPVAYVVDKNVRDRAKLVNHAGQLLWIGIAVLVAAILADTFWLLFPALCLNGIFYELFSSATEALFADSAGVTGDRAGWYVKKQIYITVAAACGPLITLIMALADGEKEEGAGVVGNHLSAPGARPYDFFGGMNVYRGGLLRSTFLPLGLLGGSSWMQGLAPGSSSDAASVRMLAADWRQPEEVPSTARAGYTQTATASEASSILAEMQTETRRDAATAGGAAEPSKNDASAAGAGTEISSSWSPTPQLPVKWSEYQSRRSSAEHENDVSDSSFSAEEESSGRWSLAFMHFVLLGGVVVFVPMFCFLYGYRDLIQEQDEDGEAKESKDEVLLKNLTRGQKAIPYLCAGSDFIVSIGAGMTVKFFNLFFIEDYGFTPLQISLLQMAYPLTIAVFTLLLGRIAKVCGRAQTSAVSFTLNALCMLAMAHLQDVRLLLAIFLIRGGMANGVAPLDKSIVMDYTPSSQRGTWNAVESFMSITWSGSAFLGGYIADVSDYRETFRYTGLIYLVGTLIYLPLVFLVPRKAAAADSEAETPTAREVDAPFDETPPSANSGREMTDPTEGAGARTEPLLVVQGRSVAVQGSSGP